MAEGQVVLITGGTGQVGQVVVEYFAARGAQVVVPYRSAERWEQLRAQLGELASRVIGIAAGDLADPAAARALVEEALAQAGRVDAVLCLAGGFVGGRFTESGPEQWLQMMAINFWPTVHVLRAAVPQLLAQGHGRIVTVGARTALEPAGGATAYVAAKGAVITLTQALARELRGSGVTVNCIAPGTIDTPANREAMPKADPKTWVKPEEIAALLWYLCSPEAAAVTGAVIPIPGRG